MNLIMKIRHFFAVASAAASCLVACTPEQENLGTPDISISETEMTFEVAGGEQELTVTATRDWKVETDADWVVVDPESGYASADPQTVSVTVLENPGLDREADLKFTIGMKSKYLTVSQAGPGGSAEALVVYSNDFDKTKAEKASSGWNTYLDSFDGWLNVTGTGAGTVTYGFQKMTARTNSGNGSAGSYSDYVELGASGMNYLWFGSAPTYFAIKNITLPEGKTDFTLSFGSERYLYEATDNTFNWDEFKTYVSIDGQKWVRPEFAFAGGSLPNGRWDLASTTLTVPTGTTSFYIYFAPTIGSAYAIDDLKLVQAASAGTALDFANGEEFEVGDNTTGGGNTGDIPDGTGEGTLESPYDAAKATKVASALADGETKASVYVKGIVKSFKDVTGIATYGNISYYITDADGAANFYVFRGKYLDNANFTSEDQLKVGDEVVVYGDLVNYMGNTPELAQGNYIVSLNSSTGGGNSGGGETPSIDKPASLVKATIAEFLAAEEDDTWYELTGEIVKIETGNAYGNFTIKDATDEVYIYGMTSKWVGSNDKSFASLGLKETDIVTLGTLRGSFNGTPQGGGSLVPAYYISHEPGAGLPEDPSGTVELTFSADTQEKAGSYTSEWSATIGTNSWKIVNFNNNNNQWSYIKCGHKSTSNTATITTKNALAGTITSVVVQVDKIIDASKCTTKLEVASDASFSNIVETVNVTIAQGEVNYALTTPQTNCYYRLVFDCIGLGGSTNGNVQISKVKYLPAE